MGSFPPPPSYLLDRYRGWRANRFSENKGWYTKLAEEGQRPRVMVISCCDSRVEPSAIFGADAGEIFMVRNVANLVPPYQPDDARHGTSAAIEFAVTGLKVSNIIVMGHALCGGVAAYHDACGTPESEPVESGEFIGPWVSVLKPAYDRMKDMDADRKERLTALEHQGVIGSLQNLMSFPFIANAVDSGRLSLHGAWFDIGAGMLHVYNSATDRFEPVA